MVIPLTWDDAFTPNNLYYMSWNSAFVPKQIGSAKKAWEHGEGYAAPSAQMFSHCVAQHIQLQNSLPPENKAKEISVPSAQTSSFLQTSCRFSFLEVTSGSCLAALEEIWQQNQLKILKTSQNNEERLIKSNHCQHCLCKPEELRVLSAVLTVPQGSKFCQISQNGPHSPPKAHVHHQHSFLYAFPECDMKPQLRFSPPSSSRAVTMLRNQIGYSWTWWENVSHRYRRLFR